MKRNKRKQAKARQVDLELHKQIKLYEEVLDVLCHGDEFRTDVPTSVKAILVKYRHHFPLIVTGPTAAGDPAAPGIVAELKSVFDRTFNAPRATMTMGNWLVAFPSLGIGTERILRQSVSRKCYRFFTELHRFLVEVGERTQRRTLDELASNLWMILASHFRVNKWCYWCRYRGQGENAGSRDGLEVSLGRTPAQVAMVSLDGARRSVFRCGLPTVSDPGMEGPSWVSWDGELLGRKGDPATYPVYIQTHAINQLHNRVRLDGQEGTVHACMCLSLWDPNVVSMRGNEALVEYTLGDDRLGYLVARLLPDKVVVRTFLFLTMQGTPEATLLRQRLRLHRPDIEYNRLDRLDTFLTTDLGSDPVLIQLLEECGCGHLPSLGLDEGRKRVTSGYAASLRKYLGMEGDDQGPAWPSPPPRPGDPEGLPQP